MENGENAPAPKYRRVVLKLSGEALCRPGGPPIEGDILGSICREIKEVHDFGVQTGLVIGGGNIFRGQENRNTHVIDRATADFMGMLATVINGLAVMDCLEKLGVPVRLQSAIPMDKVAEPFILRRAVRHMEKGRLVIFAAGTGNPFFSTDTTAALRASELGADIILKATKVDGVYDKDPEGNPGAVKYEEISYMDALRQQLSVMDATAFSLCKDNRMPILVFSMKTPGGIRKAVLGEKIGTLVH